MIDVSILRASIGLVVQARRRGYRDVYLARIGAKYKWLTGTTSVSRSHIRKATQRGEIVGHYTRIDGPQIFEDICAHEEISCT